MYKIKEIYYTIQGEGGQAGSPAVFCRFSGCNLWSGREEDRHKAICQFCDTNFWGTDGVLGGNYSAIELTKQIDSLFPTDSPNKMVVVTGGEPALQIDDVLIKTLHKFDISIAIETNGTLVLPPKIDWVCVSPKANTTILVKKGQELKLVYPQEGMEPSQFEDLDFEHFYIQPKEDENWEKNTEQAIEFVKQNPKWRLSVQTHKYIGIA